jgi:hypothetical protein
MAFDSSPPRRLPLSLIKPSDRQGHPDGTQYGWEFFDIADRTFPPLSNRLSFDDSFGTATGSHSLYVFQEGNGRHLDLWLWFDHFTVRDPLGVVIPLNEFVAGCRRWWDAFHRLDPRTQGHGIYQLS